MSETWASAPEVVASGQPGSVITLVEGSTFCISGRSGDMRPDAAQGFFFKDARFLSRFEISINGRAIEPLTVSVDDPFAGTFVSRAHPRPGRADSTIMVFRKRVIAGGIREEIVVQNYAEEATLCVVEIDVDADFANVFSVKENRVRATGELSRSLEGSVLAIRHDDSRSRRAVDIEFSQPFNAVNGNNNKLAFEPVIEANGEWTLSMSISTTVNDDRVGPRERGDVTDEGQPNNRLTQWRNKVPVITTNHIPLAAAVRRGQEDLGSLRIFDPQLSDRPVIAAGAPWFMTLFGRDSLLTAWMALIVDPGLAVGVLDALARFQGKEEVPETDEQPGRILHEMRSSGGDMLGFDRANVYYGSVDSSPLFVMLLGELRRWGLAPELTQRLLPHADRALAWIENYGDRDGDGYVEYERLADTGIRNQGWKDSFDAVRFADGRLADTPIALAEVQGYVFAAYQARKWFAREAGDHETAERYRNKAKALKAAFNRDFWLEERGCFAMALDANKVPVDAVASNMGHCLWTGIVDNDKAESVAKTLLAPAMFTGWGIRTLASNMAGYNPIGYHVGSVWPHDSVICAAGLSRYGFLESARTVIFGLLEASLHDEGRLPELFSGLDRSVLSIPVSFPTSCSPQAWAAASPLLALRTLLRFDPSVPQGHLVLGPNLGSEISHLRLERIPFFEKQIAVDVSEGEVTVEGLDEDIRVLSPEERDANQ